jgi:tripartite-type tricarboxylate transporter receptor subunit TctC
MAPKGTPKEVVDKVNAAMQTAMKQAALQEAWAKQGAVPMLMSPSEFETLLKKDIEKWAAVVKTANIKPQ